MSSQDEMIEDLCRQADASYRSGDIQGARQIYEAVLQLDSGHERALEGLALTSLTDAHWSLVDKSTGTNPAVGPGLARARDLLASGLLDEAQQAVDELVRQAPGHADVQALAAEVKDARQRAPMMAKALLAARQALSRGDTAGAVAACRSVLAIEPGHREAEMLLEQAEMSLGPASVPSDSSVSLELDLDLAMSRVAPVPPVAPPSRPAPAPLAAAAPGGRFTAFISAPQAVPSTSPSVVAATATAVLPEPEAGTFDAAPEPAWESAASAWEPVADPETATTGGHGWDMPTWNAGPEPDLFGAVVSPTGAPAPVYGADDFGRQAGSAYADGEGMGDLLDAARDLNDARVIDTPQQAYASLEQGNAAEEGEAALLVARAREEFENGHVDDARVLAARALAVCETVSGASELLDEIQNVADRAAREADDLLSQAIAEYDRGRPDLAVPLLSQVLVLAPGHPEALDYLDKAEAARDQLGFGRHDDGRSDAGGLPPDELASIPLQQVRPAPVKNAENRAWLGSGASAAGSDLAEAPAVPPLGAAPASPVTPPAAPAAARPRPAAPPPVRQASGSVYAIPRGIAVGIAVVVLATAAGSWYLWQSLSGLAAQAAPADGVAAPVRRARIRPAAPAPAATATATPGEQAKPQYTRADIPALLGQAQSMLKNGREADAVALLVTVRALDETDLAAADLLSRARAQLRTREDGDRALAEARADFAREDFQEALRIFYRLPESHKPANLNRWIANAWYNAGVQRLQIFDLGQAREFFGSCLEVQPDDAGAKRNLEVARRYGGKTTDDAYRIYVQGLTFRGLDDRN